MKIKVTLEIDYKVNGTKKNELKELLRYAMEHLASNGLFTGETPAEVNEWKYKFNS